MPESRAELHRQIRDLKQQVRGFVTDRLAIRDRVERAYRQGHIDARTGVIKQSYYDTSAPRTREPWADLDLRMPNGAMGDESDDEGRGGGNVRAASPNHPGWDCYCDSCLKEFKGEQPAAEEDYEWLQDMHIRKLGVLVLTPDMEIKPSVKERVARWFRI